MNLNLRQIVADLAGNFIPAMVIGLWLALCGTCLWVFLRPGPIDVAVERVLSTRPDAGAAPEVREPIAAGADPNHLQRMAP